MTGTPSPTELLARADKLVAEARWQELHGLLSEVPRSELFSSSELAYRHGEALYHLGRMTDLAAYASELEAAMRRARDTKGVMRALNLGGIAAFELGDVAEARGRFDALLELAEGEKDDDMLARAANNLGALANLQGRRAEALSMYRLALPLYQKLGQTRGLAQTHQNLGISFRDLGQYEEAAAAYREAAELGRGFGYSPIVAMATVGRAEVEVLRGDPELAASFAEAGLLLARQVGDPITEGTALRVRAMTRAGGGEEDLDAALADLEEARRLGRETGHVLLEAEAERDTARVLVRSGRPAEGLQALRSALAKLESLGAELQVRALSAEAEEIASQLS